LPPSLASQRHFRRHYARLTAHYAGTFSFQPSRHVIYCHRAAFATPGRFSEDTPPTLAGTDYYADAALPVSKHA